MTRPMIRPEIRAFLSRWAEALVALVVVLLGFLIVLRG